MDFYLLKFTYKAFIELGHVKFEFFYFFWFVTIYGFVNPELSTSTRLKDSKKAPF